jgi:Aerotolerance regulator N-terminal
MNFLFPTFLFGLIAIAIPIIIHLFNFRKYKKVYFTNVQFLKELKQESDSKSKLKELLILLMRILAIACLVIAFAQPFTKGNSPAAQGEKAVGVYIDNSFSMEGTNKKGTLLENAKTYATEIINSFDASDKFQVITNDFEGKHQRFLSKEEAIEQVNEVKISSATKPLSDVVKRQQDFLANSNSKNKKVFLLSDFQKNTTNFIKNELDTAIAITCVPITASDANNVYIDSIWFETPIQQYQTQQKIHAVVINKSSKDIENGTLKLFINGKQISLNSFNISAGNKADVSIAFTVKDKGINKGILSIEDYPITYDDNFYFSFNAQTIINALVINGKESKTASNFKSLMLNDSLFNYKESNETAIDYSVFSKTTLIVVNELSTITSGLTSELQKFLNQGGSLVIFPKNNADLESYNTAFKALQLPTIISLDTARTKSQVINFEQGLYQGVFDKIDQRMDLPTILKHYEYTNTTNSSKQNIISLQNGSSFLAQYKYAEGKVYLFSSPSDLSCTNFLKHALFVPTLIKMSILSLKPSPIYYQTAQNEAIEVEGNATQTEKPMHIINDKKSADVIPEHRIVNGKTTLFTQNQINEAGHYQVVDNTTILNGLAFNYNRKESNLEFTTAENLQKTIEDGDLKNVSVIEPNEKSLTKSIQEINDGKKLWKWFLILGLVFLALEILIIRLFK